MMRRWIITGLTLMILGIILGAFGAHGLKKIVFDINMLEAFETAVRYQLIHALAFLIIPLLLDRFNLVSKAAYWLLFSGVLLFSGSIYLLVIQSVAGISWLSFAGPLTPVGGMLMIAGWLVLLIRFIVKKE